MRILLMLVGIALSAGSFCFWIYMNALGASWRTSSHEWSIDWLSDDALHYFWLPFAIGVAIAVIGWRWKRR